MFLKLAKVTDFLLVNKLINLSTVNNGLLGLCRNIPSIRRALHGFYFATYNLQIWDNVVSHLALDTGFGFWFPRMTGTLPFLTIVQSL